LADVNGAIELTNAERAAAIIRERPRRKGQLQQTTTWPTRL